MRDYQVLMEESARRMAKAISKIPKDDFELYSMLMDAVLLGARMARQPSVSGSTPPPTVPPAG